MLLGETNRAENKLSPSWIEHHVGGAEEEWLTQAWLVIY